MLKGLFMLCLLCGKDYKTVRALGTHISLKHHISTENYYISFMGEINYCKECNKKTTFINLREGFHTFCSTRCSELSKETKEKKKQNCLEKHGVEYNTQRKDVREKIEESNLQKYGVKCASQSEIVKDKSKRTCLEKYGVEHNFQREEFKEKCKETCLEKYGVEHHRKSEIVKEKFLETCQKKYGVDYPIQHRFFKEKSKSTCLTKYNVPYVLQSKELREKYREYIRSVYKKLYFERLCSNDQIKNKCTPLFSLEEYNGVFYKNKYPWRCTICNNEFVDHIDNGHIPRCPVCYPPASSGSSLLEKEVCDFCKQYYPNLIENDRSVLNGKELDIYIPEINLAIEFDGLYWHSEGQGTSKDYHLNKTNECEKKGIQLIHIFENEWWDKKDIVKSILLTKMNKSFNKIYARKCKIIDITEQRELVQTFLNNNHIQGSLIYYEKSLGLFYDGDLVFLIVYGKSRFNHNYDIELLRVCSKLNTIVIGGLSKLMKHISKDNKKIISYSDRRYFCGDGYVNSGFKLINKSTPNYFYFNNLNKLLSRQNFQKHKLSNLLETFDPNLTEWQNMQLNGYDRIWDCGNLVFEYVG